MIIEAYQQADTSRQIIPVDSFTVMFNPNTYTQSYGVEYHDRQGEGDTGSHQIFNKIKPRDYKFDFVIDGTGVASKRVDVQRLVDNFFTVVGYDGEIHRPKYLKLIWGALVARCILKTAETTYTLFKPDGYPLRAKIKAHFSEYIDDAKRVKQQRNSSPDLTHVRVVREGERLSLLCQQIYGTSEYYLQVAAYNELNNFRKLVVGQTILFPPVKTLPQS